MLDLWGDETQAVSAGERRSFVDWRRAAGDGEPDERYPPRALVGRYLADGLARLCAAAPAHVTIARHRTSAQELQRRGCGVDDRDVRRHRAARATTRCSWRSATRPAAATGPRAAMAARGPARPGRLPGRPGSRAAHVAPGATVAVRGFALTFLDAALALTEGRGGALRAGRSSVPAALHAVARRRRRDRAVLAHRAGRCSPSPTRRWRRASRRWRRSPGPRARRSSPCLTASAFATTCCAILAAAVAASLRAAGQDARARAPQRWLGVACDGRRAADVALAGRGDRALARGRCRLGRAGPAVGARTHVAGALPGARRPARRTAGWPAGSGRRSARWRCNWSGSRSARPRSTRRSCSR